MRIGGKFRDDGSILLRSIEAMVRQRVAITSDLLRHKVVPKTSRPRSLSSASSLLDKLSMPP